MTIGMPETDDELLLRAQRVFAEGHRLSAMTRELIATSRIRIDLALLEYRLATLLTSEARESLDSTDGTLFATSRDDARARVDRRARR
jgi:hypothetical protein